MLVDVLFALQGVVRAGESAYGRLVRGTESQGSGPTHRVGERVEKRQRLGGRSGDLRGAVVRSLLKDPVAAHFALAGYLAGPSRSQHQCREWNKIYAGRRETTQISFRTLRRSGARGSCRLRSWGVPSPASQWISRPRLRLSRASRNGEPAGGGDDDLGPDPLGAGKLHGVANPIGNVNDSGFVQQAYWRRSVRGLPRSAAAQNALSLEVGPESTPA